MSLICGAKKRENYSHILYNANELMNINTVAQTHTHTHQTRNETKTNDKQVELEMKECA